MTKLSRTGFDVVFRHDLPVVRLALGVVLALALSGCAGDSPGSADSGGLDGPVMFAGDPDPSGSDAALIEGTLELEGGCLYVRSAGADGPRYPVLWPNGTRWQDADSPEESGVLLADGTLLPLGSTIREGGGYPSTERLPNIVGNAEVLERAAACAEGPSFEIAFVQS